MFVTYMNKKGDVKEIDTRQSAYGFAECEGIRLVVIAFEEYNKETKSPNVEYGIVLKQYFIKEKTLDEYMDWFSYAVFDYDGIDELYSLYRFSKKVVNALLKANLLDKFIEDEYSTTLKYFPIEKEFLTVDKAKESLKFLEVEE